MKRFLFAFSIASVLCLTSSAFAQDDPAECNAENSISVESVVASVTGLCCGAATSSERNSCINKQSKKIRKLKPSLTPKLVADMITGLKALKSSDCNGAGVASCSAETSGTLSEVNSTQESKCCDLNQNRARKRCLKGQRKAWSKMGGLAPQNYIDTIKGDLNGFLKAQSCGKGGKKSNCNIVRNNGDGQGGFVWKPHSDSTGSVVVLWPSSDSPSDCRFETSTGKQFRGAFSSGRTNGFRETIRPFGGGSCSNFPKNSVMNCQLGGKRVCYKAPDPCNRYD